MSNYEPLHFVQQDELPRDRKLISGQFVLYLSQNLLAYAIVDARHQRLHVLKSQIRKESAAVKDPYPAEVAQFLRDCQPAPDRFREARVIFDFRPVVWTPTPLISNGISWESLLESSAGSVEGYQAHACPIDDAEAHIVFGYPMQLADLLEEYLPEASFWHGMAAWIAHLQERESTSHAPDRPRLYLDVQGHLLSVLLYREEQLLLCNTYSCPGHSDALYFALLALHIHQLKVEDCDCYLSGMIPSGGPLDQLLRQYLPQVQEIVFPEGWSFPTQMEVIPKKAYFKILGVVLCEL